MTDLYGILGVERDSDKATIRKAYRKLAQGAHPDRGGHPEQFREIKLAHDVLTDGARRKRYDETGETDHETDAQRMAKQRGEFLPPFMAEGIKDFVLDPMKAIRGMKKNLEKMLGTVEDEIGSLKKDIEALGGQEEMDDFLLLLLMALHEREKGREKVLANLDFCVRLLDQGKAALAALGRKAKEPGAKGVQFVSFSS